MYPTFAVWENVPGAFSSNKGEDFRIVLEELVKIRDENAVIPQPPGGRWRTVGAIMGDGWSIAWRVFDSQFWGVPQRRRRISLVIDLRGQRAPEVLFERAGLRRDSQESGTARKGTSRAATERADRTSVYGFSSGQGAKARSIGFQAEISPTLRAAESGSNRAPCIAIQHSIIGREAKNGAQGKGWRDDDKAFTLDSRPEADAVCFPDVTGTLTARIDGSPAPGHMSQIVTVPKADKASSKIYDARGNGDGETACTITGDHNNRVTDYTCLISEPMVMATGQGNAEISQGISSTLNCNHEQPIVFGLDSEQNAMVDKIGTIRAHCSGGAENNVYNGYCVRRVTPLECERLQGYPDEWTNIPPYIDSKGKQKTVSDAARYKAIGNSISIPNWKWVLKRISAQFERDALLGSLFDGIGGFPFGED